MKKFRPKTCRTCGKTFTPTHPCNLYCSVSCRGRTAYYERVYGITEGEFEQMKVTQGHKCYLCSSEGFLIGRKNHHERLAVDHDHATGRVRKLLCHNCNRALGLLKDDPELMERAAAYVRDHRKGATTIPKGSRLKRAEAHSPASGG